MKLQKAQRREDYLHRISIEGTFGQGKSGYRLNYIRAQREDTSLAWINSIFMVANLLIMEKTFFVFYKLDLSKTIVTIEQLFTLAINNIINSSPFSKKQKLPY